VEALGTLLKIVHLVEEVIANHGIEMDHQTDGTTHKTDGITITTPKIAGITTIIPKIVGITDQITIMKDHHHPEIILGPLMW
jgi:hypothetical protein